MDVSVSTNQEQNRARLIILLCAIIERELSGSCSSPQQESQLPRCPRCGNHDISKRGHDSTGKQRFSCKSCNRSFTAATGSALRSTKIPLSTWVKFAACHVEGLSLRVTADHCQISLKTAFYMRKRINQTIAAYSLRAKKILSNSHAAPLSKKNYSESNKQK
jgi:transposase-like protein